MAARVTEADTAGATSADEVRLTRGLVECRSMMDAEKHRLR